MKFQHGAVCSYRRNFLFIYKKYA